MEFKNIQFEHMVAGEVRTIEMCTEPAQILGRLRLLRRMAYAKLRGYEWHIIRKMYAAIVRSIESNENTWESNLTGMKPYYTDDPPAEGNINQAQATTTTVMPMPRNCSARTGTKATAPRMPLTSHGLGQVRMP